MYKEAKRVAGQLDLLIANYGLGPVLHGVGMALGREARKRLNGDKEETVGRITTATNAVLSLACKEGLK